MNHAQPSMNKHELPVLAAFDQLHSNCKLPLTPACLTTCCCLATFPFSDVKETVFALLPGNRTDTFIDMYIFINIFFARFHAALATVDGCAGRAFVQTDLLTSLREELEIRDSQNLAENEEQRNLQLQRL